MHVIAVRLGGTDQLEARESLVIEACRGHVLQGRVVLAVLNGRHGVGRPVEPDDLDVTDPLARPRTCRPPRRPARRQSSARRPACGCFEIGPGPDRAASPRHQLQLIDVVRARRQVIAGSRLGPFVAVTHEVDPTGVEDLKQLVPLTLRELGCRAQVFRQPVHQFDFEAGHIARRTGIGVGIRAAPFHVAAVEQAARNGEFARARQPPRRSGPSGPRTDEQEKQRRAWAGERRTPDATRR